MALEGQSVVGGNRCGQWIITEKFDYFWCVSQSDHDKFSILMVGMNVVFSPLRTRMFVGISKMANLILP
jgi:hypothetical protein